jgi:hypothetical protein
MLAARKQESSGEDLHVLMDVVQEDLLKLKGEAEEKLNEEIKKKNLELEHIKKEMEEMKKKLKKEMEDHMMSTISNLSSTEEKLNTEIEKIKQDVLKEIEVLQSRLDHQENDNAVEEHQGEPGIALEDQLRITEQSAKAIDLLKSHLFSTVWQTCSKNTYGNEIRSYGTGLVHFRI